MNVVKTVELAAVALSAIRRDAIVKARVASPTTFRHQGTQTIVNTVGAIVQLGALLRPRKVTDGLVRYSTASFFRPRLRPDTLPR